MIGNKIHHFDTIDSTNTYALQLIGEGDVKEGTVIQADYQSSGRGQMSKSWEGKSTENVYMSVILKPAFLALEKQFFLNKIASLAIIDVINEYMKVDVKVKWPNDVYIGDNKTCGILIQNILGGKTIQHTVLGIGLNVNQEVYPESLTNPTSLKIESRKQFSIQEVISRISTYLDFWYAELRQGNYKKISYAYIEKLYKCDEEAQFQSEGLYFKGIIRGIDSRGKLMIEKNNGVHGYALHEIKMIIN